MYLAVETQVNRTCPESDFRFTRARIEVNCALAVRYSAIHPLLVYDEADALVHQ